MTVRRHSSDEDLFFLMSNFFTKFATFGVDLVGEVVPLKMSRAAMSSQLILRRFSAIIIKLLFFFTPGEVGRVK